MVAIRTTLRLFVALAATVAVSASFYEGEDSLDLRELGLDYQVPFTRGFSDGDDFVLTARDLEFMGVRSEDISHVLVVRATPRRSKGHSPGASKAELQRQLKVHKEGLKSAKAKVKECKAKIKAAKDDKTKKFWKNELESASEMVKYEEEEILELEELIKHAI